MSLSLEMSFVITTGSPIAQYSPFLIGVQNLLVGTGLTGQMAKWPSDKYNGTSPCCTNLFSTIFLGISEFLQNSSISLSLWPVIISALKLLPQKECAVLKNSKTSWSR